MYITTICVKVKDMFNGENIEHLHELKQVHNNSDDSKNVSAGV